MITNNFVNDYPVSSNNIDGMRMLLYKIYIYMIEYTLISSIDSINELPIKQIIGESYLLAKQYDPDDLPFPRL